MSSLTFRSPRRCAPNLAYLLTALAALILLVPTTPARAQSFDATRLLQPTDLGVTWLVQAGDDPAFAQPGFDDSQWMRVDTNKSLKEYFPSTHPSVIWYRLHVKVAPSQTGLALAEWNLASAFEIYANGQKLIESGGVVPYRPYTFSARLLHRIPDSALASGSLVIAMRVHISGNDWVGAFPGYYPSNLTIGQENALSDHIWLLTIGSSALRWFYGFAGLGLGWIALALYTAQRGQREYLWIFLLFLVSALAMPLETYQLFHNLPAGSAYFSGCFQIADLVCQTMMYLAFLRMPVVRWMQALLALSATGVLLSSMQTANGNGSSLGVSLSVLPELCLIAGVIPVLLLVHWRRGNGEAGILLIPAVVTSISIYLEFGSFMLSQIPGLGGPVTQLQMAIFNWKVGPFTIAVDNLSGCLFVLTLAIILVLRSTRIAAQQAHIETELAAAREVQQILVPEAIEQVPGFLVESAYEPAQQVGGDFFQILPASEGSLLVVIGDVAGKGLPAAMLVSVLVGAIRAAADYTTDPAELLMNLNQRMVGRVGANFATALAARIDADGSVALANAGHLPPYLDGREVNVPGALPLGAREGTHYETVHFALPAGSRLTVYSDGIVEAQNATGELFGFDRTRGIATQPVAKMIEAARHFGQQDDMTAISIARPAAPPAAVEATAAIAPAFGLATS
jgi:sigma-B regulation protein RsbU (phosphoserine phosphatase)